MTKKSTAQPEAPDYKDLYQRSLAEVENTRKRFEQEKQQISRYALGGAAESLLPVVDNFYRATEHVPAEQQGSPWLAGIFHIQKQLLDTLAEWGVREMAVAPGDSFNPAEHEAIGTVVQPDQPEDQIVTVSARGYFLHGRILRPARVITSKKTE